MVWVLLAVVIILLVAVGVLAGRQRRSNNLKEQFGPEYGRVVAEQGDQRAAEKELAARRQRVNSFELRELEPAKRDVYLQEWATTQREFVDEPVAAVAQAHALVQRVMQDRGYPADEDFEQRAADISVDHPAFVENYRAAHAISVSANDGQASTEELRQAMIHFRSLFDDLLAPDDARQSDGPAAGSAPTQGAGILSDGPSAAAAAPEQTAVRN